MEHAHYVVQGFELYETNGGLGDLTTIEVVASSEDEALSLASNLVNKKHYRVSSVISHDPEIEQVSAQLAALNGYK